MKFYKSGHPTDPKIKPAATFPSVHVPNSTGIDSDSEEEHMTSFPIDVTPRKRDDAEPTMSGKVAAPGKENTK